VVTPARGESGYRLYSEGDEHVLRRMVALVEGGLAPAEAARRALGESGEPDPADVDDVPISELRDALSAALEAFDDRLADRVLDRAVTVLSTDALLEQVLLPVLRDLDSNTIGQEHFASSLIRGRLLALARGWGGGEGRRALLACPGGEFHDLGLIAFGLALRSRGWRIAFLGGDTPVETLRSAVAATSPDAVVLFAIEPARYEDAEEELARLAAETPLMLSGPGAGEELCERVGAARLARGPVEEAAAIDT